MDIKYVTSDKPCEKCHQHFDVRPNMRSRARYCASCRTGQHTADHYARLGKKCPCGGPIIDWRKYCSDECKIKYGLTGKTHGERLTKVCLGCGEEFEGPASYIRKRKYCSNKCAHKEQKKGWSKAALQDDNGLLIFRSGFEVRFYAWCLREGIPVRSYDGPDVKTRDGKNYRPDFIIHDDVVVEVKGWTNGRALERLEDAADSGLFIWMVTEVELVEMGA